MEILKEKLVKYRHAVPAVAYGIIYLIWFGLLEQRKTTDYMLIHMNIDDYIPFCEWFVIPYLLWFLYVPAVLVYLFFKDREGYWKNAVFLGTGMTVFLLISTLVPNIQHLRPQHLVRENIFTWLVEMIWKADTPTNLFPSIHVYNSLGAHFAVLNNEKLSGNKWLRRGSFLLCTLIVLSTMFIKQHSMFDVLTAFIMAAGMHAIVYYYDQVAVWKCRYYGRKARKRA